MMRWPEIGETWWNKQGGGARILSRPVDRVEYQSVSRNGTLKTSKGCDSLNGFMHRYALGPSATCPPDPKDVTIAALRSRVAVLESALREHGHHSSVCSFGRDPGDPCDCWIAAALATVPR